MGLGPVSKPSCPLIAVISGSLLGENLAHQSFLKPQGQRPVPARARASALFDAVNWLAMPQQALLLCLCSQAKSSKTPAIFSC